MKACLAEGIEPVAFEADSDLGGFWRYKEEAFHPSVYRSTHIDSDRDQNSFGDFPWGAEKSLLIHNAELVRYLRQNCEEFNLLPRIRFNCTVTLVTPLEGRAGALGPDSWEVRFLEADPATGRRIAKAEVFDGVLVCSGRHGGGGFTPRFPFQERFKGQILHSSKYKYPEKHGLVGKDVVVVGIGNSGQDIVTEFGMLNGGGMRKGDGVVVNGQRGRTYLVARSGGWVQKVPHMDVAMGAAAREVVGESNLGGRAPWWYKSALQEAPMAENQALLNRHGMTPKHRFLQQHPILSGFAGQVWLGEQLEKGWIRVKRGVNLEKGFSEDGSGIWLNDQDGNPEPAPTRCDAVIFATGYRQQAGFLDPKVVDMRFERQGNDVPLYRGCLPISPYRGLGFVNFVQSLTFPCAEVQSRWLTRAFKGLIPLPPLEEQRREMEETRNTLTALFVDRSQLRVQHGTEHRYYQQLVDEVGCLPTFWRVLTQRPTALWHAFCAFGGSNQMPNRLVGPGRLEKAEQWIEERYQARYFGTYRDAGGAYDHNPVAGQPINGDGLGPLNRRDEEGWVDTMQQGWRDILGRLEEFEGEGLAVGPFDRPQEIRAHLAQNLRYAKEDTELRGILHSGAVGDEVRDGYLDKGGVRDFAFANRATDKNGGLAMASGTPPARQRQPS